MKVSEVHIGPCSARVFDVEADRWAVILPGARYSADAPLLWFAREAALASGRNVLAVYDTWRGGDDPLGWVRERAEAALGHIGPDGSILIAKSITTLATEVAAERGLPAVWLTPLLAGEGGPVSKAVIDGLRASSAPRLLVGGSADPTWDGSVASSLGDSLEISGADQRAPAAGRSHALAGGAESGHSPADGVCCRDRMMTGIPSGSATRAIRSPHGCSAGSSSTRFPAARSSSTAASQSSA
jgi:hypothetical protein